MTASDHHTPGPLIVRVGANGDVGIIATSQASTGKDIGGALVAECFAEIRCAGEGARGEALANATLFAASHDLLHIAKCWAALDAGAWHVERHAREKAELLSATAAAIIKATGAAS